MKELIKKWIAFARADLEAANVQLRYGKARWGAYQIAIFHIFYLDIPTFLLPPDFRLPIIEKMQRTLFIKQLNFLYGSKNS